MEIKQLKFDLYVKLRDMDKQKPFSLSISDFQLYKILSIDNEIKEFIKSHDIDKIIKVAKNIHHFSI